MKKSKNTIINNANIREMVELLKKNDKPQMPLYWVASKNFFLSSTAKLMGFDCTEEELIKATKGGFIKTARGINLYISKFLPF